MAMIQKSSLPPAVVLDASIAVALCAKEAITGPLASAEIARLSAMGYEFFIPGVIVGETLYVLCGKVQAGTLSATDHAQAVQDFAALMTKALPPPDGRRH